MTLTNSSNLRKGCGHPYLVPVKCTRWHQDWLKWENSSIALFPWLLVSRNPQSIPLLSMKENLSLVSPARPILNICHLLLVQSFYTVSCSHSYWHPRQACSSHICHGDSQEKEIILGLLFVQINQVHSNSSDVFKFVSDADPQPHRHLSPHRMGCWCGTPLCRLWVCITTIG